MKRILSLGVDAGFHIIKSVYNKFENKNFYKPNMSKTDIAFLNTDLNITIYGGKEFADALFDRCISLLHHILYICKDEYTVKNISTIYENIEHIQNTMRTEIYDKKLHNIIETELRNNNIDNRSRISKYIQNIKEQPDVKSIAKTSIENMKTIENDIKDEYAISINDNEFNDNLGDPAVVIGLSRADINMDFILNRFDDSKFFKFWKDRIKEEKKYIYSNMNKTIGDIANLQKREEKINNMLEIIRLRHEKQIPGEIINLDIDGNDSIMIYYNDYNEDNNSITNISNIDNTSNTDNINVNDFIGL